MSSSAVEASQAPRRGVRSWIAGGAAAALVAGTLVVAGIGAQTASAAPPPPPGVSVAEPDSYLAGEDLTLGLTFTGGSGAGQQYNLSAGVVLPADAVLQDTGALLGSPSAQYAAGEVLPGLISPGSDPGTCAALGLAELQPPQSGSCRVAPGTQYIVFQNIADLPQESSISDSLTLRPDADTFPVGDEIPYRVNVYTSGDPRYIPVFPGSTGVSTPPALEATSNPGTVVDEVAVNAMRIEKIEPSPEDELLRGVHDHSTTYTLRVWYTGQGPIDEAEVVDHLPAGLEYLGMGGLDHTGNANGTQGVVDEYPGSGDLRGTPAPDPSSWDGAVAPERNAGELPHTVETVNDVSGHGLVAGEVYTRVSWDLAGLLQAGADYNLVEPVVQSYSDAAGQPGMLEIRYRAAVPLFENTMDFGYDAEATGQQAANLDNNRGASTRHGDSDLTERAASANRYENVAVARGLYEGAAVEDSDSESVDAVDVRVLKRIGDRTVGATGSFEQGNLVRYRLELATSEYVRAELGDPVDTGDATNDSLRLVDDMADGLCPVFAPGTKVWPDSSNPHGEDVPNLVLGTYNRYQGRDPGPVQRHVDPVTWNQALEAAGVDSICQWGSDESQALSDSDALEGAFLSGIAFDPESGRFLLEYTTDGADALDGPNRTHTVGYSVHQNTRYIEGTEKSEQGATSSMDAFENEAEINARTTPIDALDGVASPADRADTGPWNAWDDSHAWVRAGETGLTKHVLTRGAGVPDREDVGDVAADQWVQTVAENEPFTVGDQAWYRIEINPPSGADVRNPVFTDFLPEGVSFDLGTLDPATQRPEDMWIVPGSTDPDSLPWLAGCAPDPAATTPGEKMLDWLSVFVPVDGMRLQDRSLTFDLGSDECFGTDSSDRFLPFETTLEIYLKVTVTDPSRFDAVDMPENLAKFQYQNVAGEVFALRDRAEIEADRAPRLLKGIAQNAHSGGSSGNGFDSNVDGETVVQGTDVTFRLDVTAPFTETGDYVLYDVLPAGFRKSDVKHGAEEFSAATVENGVETVFAIPAPTLLDPGDAGYDALALKAGIGGRSLADRTVIVWSVPGPIPGSTRAAEGREAVERGFTLGYTVTIPGENAAERAAQITQRHVNDASIVSFHAMTNDGGEVELLIDGTENVAETPAEGELAEGQMVFDDRVNDTSDPSNVVLPGAKMEKTLERTEVGPGGDLVSSNNGDGQVVQGELATYRYSVTVPAHTSVENGRLFDRGYYNRGGTTVPYEYLDGSATFLVDGVPVACDATGEFPAHSAVFGCAEEAPATGTRPSGQNTLYGVLDFPEIYHNGTDDDQVFGVEITVWVKDRDATDANSLIGYNPQLEQGNALRNVASFTFADPNSATGATARLEDDATAQYVEPRPTLRKIATHTDGEPVAGPGDPVVKPGGTVDYRLTVANDANRPALFDGVVYDCVPRWLTPVSFDTGGNGDAAVAGSGCSLDASGGVAIDADGVPTTDGSGTTLIRWELGQPVLPGANATLTYRADVSDRVGGGQLLRNGALVIGYTLPDEVDGADTTERRGDRIARSSEDVRLTTAALAKSVRVAGDDDFVELAQAPVGATVEYRVVATFPADANYYDVELTDTLPVGLAYEENSSNAVIDWRGAPDQPTIGQPRVDGQTLTWVAKSDDLDVTTHSADRTITITFQARVTDQIDDATSRNTAFLSWNSEDGEDGTRVDRADPADVTVLNPILEIVKKVDGEDSITRELDASFDYTIEVTNTGDTPSFDNVVVDRVPAGVIVDTTQAALSGAAFEDEDGNDTSASLNAGTGGVITWAIADGLQHEGGDDPDMPKSIALGYTGVFVDPAALPDAAPFANVVNVREYASFDEDGWIYHPPQRLPGEGELQGGGELPGGGEVPPANDAADVRPIFPHVELQKSVSNPVDGQQYGIATVGEAFGWVLSLVNEGEGSAQSIDVTDVLPANWEYRTGSATVTVGSGAPRQIEPTVTPQGRLGEGQRQTLMWDLSGEPLLPGTGDSAPGETPLAERTVTIAFDAVPNEHAIENAGTGIVNPDAPETRHVNLLSAETIDVTGHEDEEYTGDDDTAFGAMPEADLQLVKDAIGGTTAEATLPNGETLATGTWIPGAHAGDEIGGVAYAQPQWRIVVNNHGPDASVGPFELTDATSVPAGVTTGAWSAVYYPTAADAEAGTGGIALTVTGDAEAFEVDGQVNGAPVSLRPDGSDRIVLVADVTIGAGVTTSAEALLRNVADVVGQTYEDPDNMPEDAEHPNEDAAEKPLSPVADLGIVKRFTPVADGRNAGDPISWNLVVTNHGPSDSASSEARPIVVTDEVPAEIAEVAQLTGSALPEGWALAIDGNTVTLTLAAGTVLAVDAPVEFSFQGKISASVETATEIVNEASVVPGETPDPRDPNNEDEDVTEPISTDTTIGANKYRVEQDDAGEWVPVGAAVDVVAGTEISYRLSIANTGGADARGVTITDTLPDYLSLAGWQPEAPETGWELAQSGQQLVFTNDEALAPDAAASVIVTVVVNEGHTGDVVNTACVAAENATNEDCETDTTGSGRLVDWELEKSHTVPAAGEAVHAGEKARFQLRVHNNGPSESAGPVTVTDVLPAGFAFADNVTVAGVGTVTDTTVDTNAQGWQVVTWTVAGPFPTGRDLVTIEFDATAAADIATGIHVNDARVDGAEEEPGDDPRNNDDDDEVPVVRSATVSIEKEVLDRAGEWVESAEHVAGTEVTWRVRVVNEGPSAVPVTFTDALPDGLSLVNLTGDGWECEVASASCEYVADGGLHPVGADRATWIEITSLVSSGVAPSDAETPALVNWGRIVWVDNTSDDPSDQDDAEITTVRRADLGIEKVALDAAGEETAAAVAGESLRYRLVLSNHGPSDAVAPLVVEDLLPNGTRFVGLAGASADSWTAAAGEPNETGEQPVTFTRAPASAGLSAGAAAPEILFEVVVDPAVENGEVLHNVAAVSDGTREPNGDENPDNDRDDADVTVERRVDVAIEKGHVAATPDQFPVGAEVRFTIDATNRGPSAASGVTVTDSLPRGLAFAELSGDGWSLSGEPAADENGETVVTAVYDGRLAPGETAPRLTVTAAVTVEIGNDRTLTNGACVGTAETNLAEDPCDTDEIATEPRADLTIEKVATTPAAEITAGGTVTWLLTPRNLGPSESLSTDESPITVTDTLPEGILRLASDPSNEFWSATTSNEGGWAQATAGDTVTWAFRGDRFAVGAEPDIEVTGLIDPAWTGGEIVNIAVLAPGETPDPELPNEDDETVVPGDGTALDIWKNRVVQVDGEWVRAGTLDPVPGFVPGEEVVYLIDVLNEGPAVARDVRVVDPIPVGLDNPRVAGYQGSEWIADTAACEEGVSEQAGYTATDCLTAALAGGSLGVGETSSFLVTFDSDPGLDPESDLVNWAEADASNAVEKPSDEDSTAGGPVSDLSIVKSVERLEASEGDAVGYTLLVTNEGPSDARGPVTVTDLLPIGLDYVPGSAAVAISGGAASAAEPTVDEVGGSQRLVWVPLAEGDSLAVGDTIVITLQARVADGAHASERLVNLASVSAPDDVNPENNEDDALLVVDAPEQPQPEQPQPGQPQNPQPGSPEGPQNPEGGLSGTGGGSAILAMLLALGLLTAGAGALLVSRRRKSLTAAESER